MVLRTPSVTQLSTMMLAKRVSPLEGSHFDAQISPILVSVTLMESDSLQATSVKEKLSMCLSMSAEPMAAAAFFGR